MNVLSPKRRRARLEEHSPEERARKFFARAMAVMLVAVLSYALYAAVRPGIVGKFAASCPAYTGTLEVSSEGQALIVRDERIVATPISGSIRMVVSDGERAVAGAVVAEVGDYSVKSSASPGQSGSVQTELERFLTEAALRERRERERLAGIRLQITLKEQELQAYVGRQDVKRANKLHAEILVLQDQAKSAEQSVAAIVQEAADASRAVAQAHGQGTGSGGAGAVLRARAASLISYQTDGLEAVLNPSNPDLLGIVPEQHSPQPRRIAQNDYVNAGQAVFREISNIRTELLVITVPGEGGVGAGRRVKVRFPRLATEAVPATVIASMQRPDLGEGVWAVHVAMDRYATTLSDVRSEDAVLITDTVSGVIVPSRAVVKRRGDQGVYVLRTNRYVFRTVTVEGVSGDYTAVVGIREGDRVLVRP